MIYTIRARRAILVSENKIFDVVIVGAGAAGMMASYECARGGLNTAAAEKNRVPGKKLLITGKGRCNVTNHCDCDTVLKNTLRGSKFLYSAINGFSTCDTEDFFEKRGVPLKVERGNRVFPVSDRAEDIRKTLEDSMVKAGVQTIFSGVKSISTSDGRVSGVKLENGDTISARAVIIATGGLSYPGTGSTGDGYALARSCGHKVVETQPSLVSLKASGDIPLLQGLSLRNVTLSLFEQGKKKAVFSDIGEMLFTHYGVSGPLVLSASSHMKNSEKYTMSIDLKPGLDENRLDERILRDFEEKKNCDFSNSLDKLLPKKMIPVIISRSEILPAVKVNTITKQQRKNLCKLIKNFEIEITGKRPISEAVITRGGVSLKEIDPKTMQSKIVEGLYFAGEVMDLDGFTGGFNLQIAFSTAVAAGRAAVLELKGEKI